MGGHTVLIYVICILTFNLSSTTRIYVKWNDVKKNFELSDSAINPVAWAHFENEINKTGWAYLEVYTNSVYDDLQQAYAAGLAEAYLTHDLITKHWHNTYNGYCQHPLSNQCKKLQAFIDRNLLWMTEQIATRADNSDYWHQVQLYLEQQAGLIDGYAKSPRYPSKYSMDVTGLAMLQLAGDLEDLAEALGFPSDRVLGSGSCSALIKVLPNNQDLYVAQDTWSGLNSMLRILKKYEFSFQGAKAQTMTFSSYPGTILSGDDFYITDNKLVAIETTIGNSNPDLWQKVRPEDSVFEAIRNLVANRLAADGMDWVNIFARYNSGTYNNQWMIVDYKQFKPGQPLPIANLFYVLEQIPGYIMAKDLTGLLGESGYFASYNTPYFPEVFNASGCWANVKKYGDWFTYEHTPRANIFRRDHVKVKDTETMTRLMRYNDYTHDPLSRCKCSPPYSAENGISARSDLNPANGSYAFSALGHRSHAGTDMKLTTSSLVEDLEFIAVSSPAYDDVPVFQWSKSPFRDSVPHVGHPDVWNFKPVTHKWGYRDTK